MTYTSLITTSSSHRQASICRMVITLDVVFSALIRPADFGPVKMNAAALGRTEQPASSGLACDD
jgi:hypothetical protein